MEWVHTKAALEYVEDILKCGSCNNMVQDPCNLGSCEHFFCWTCAHDLAGSSRGQCPRCEVPVMARDVAADRQVERAVKLCHKLSQLLSQLDLGDMSSSPYSPSARQGRSSREAPSSQPPRKQPRQQSAGRSSVTRRGRQTKLSPKKVLKPSIKKRQPGRRGGGDADSVLSNADEQEAEEPLVHQHDLTQSGSDAATADSSNKEPPSARGKTTRNSRHKETTEQPWPELSQVNVASAKETVQQEAATSDGRSRRNRKQVPNAPASAIINHSTDDHEDGTSDMNADKPENNDSHVTRKVQTKSKKRASVSKNEIETVTKEVAGTSKPSVKTQKNSTKSSPNNEVSDENATNDVTEQSPAGTTSKRGQTPKFKSPSRTPVSSMLTTPKRQRKAGNTTPVGRGKRGSPVSHSPLVRSGRNSLIPRSPLAASPCQRKNAKGETPLHVAAIKGDVAAARALLSEGAPINMKDNAGWTPLHEACNHGFVEIASLLLDHGAFINAPGLDNDTPLHDAVENGRLECARLLVQRGASTTQRNLSGLTPVHLAKTAAMLEILESAPKNDEGIVGHSSQLEPSPPSQQVALLATALSREQKTQLAKLADLLHAKLVEEFSHTVTHVVSSVNAEGMCPRTLKYLQAVSCGKWIVNFDWVEQCLGHGERVSEEAFEVPGATTSPDSQAPRKGRERAFCQLPGLFDGCHFYLQGEFTDPTPTKDQLAVLLKLGGGSLLSREPKLDNLDQIPITVPYHVASDSPLANCSHYVIHDSRDRGAEVLAPRLCSAPASWLLDCIAHYTLALQPERAEMARDLLD